MSRLYLCKQNGRERSAQKTSNQIKINPLNKKTMTKETQNPKFQERKSTLFVYLKNSANNNNKPVIKSRPFTATAALLP